MIVSTENLWSLIWGTPQVDPTDLARTVLRQCQREDNDSRTQLLIRDSSQALKDYWGKEKWQRWLSDSGMSEYIQRVFREVTDEPGFSSIRNRLKEKTDPETVKQLLREAGLRIRTSTRVNIGGSISLILKGYLSRSTEVIDVVDELPEAIRRDHNLLDDLKSRYGLLLTHFQSHYLPESWDNRLHYLDTFGQLQVYLVDVYDVFLSKLFSSRTKDLDDLRMLLPQLEKDTLTDRLRRTTKAFLSSETLRSKAEKNWYILFGDELPQ